MHSFENLCERYGITKGALSQYLKPRIDEINKDGEHIVRSGQKIYFDDMAIKRLDQMRNFTSNVELAQEVAEQEAKIALLAENRKLRAKIEKLQEEKTQALADVATAYKQLESVIIIHSPCKINFSLTSRHFNSKIYQAEKSAWFSFAFFREF